MQNCGITLKQVNGGVPQGSKIGPLAFIIKINGLEEVCKGISNNEKDTVILYMDDSTLSEILSTASHVSGEQIGKMQLRLDAVVNWSNSQDMVLNGEKCKEMIIDFRTKKTEIPELQIQEIPVERVNSFKLLGLWLDNNLKWETNTWAIIKKGRKRLSFLKILKNYGAPKADLIKFYKTVIRPVLEYSDVLWAGGLTAKQRINFERVQKRALQIICPREKYENALLSNEITRLEERRRDHCIYKLG